MANVNQPKIPPLQGDAIPAAEYADMEKKAEESSKVETERKNALESQEKAHADILKNVHPALLPGKTVNLNKGLMGDFESIIREAETGGDLVKAAAINNLLARIGDLEAYVKALEEKGHCLKLLCSRIGELFK